MLCVVSVTTCSSLYTSCVKFLINGFETLKFASYSLFCPTKSLFTMALFLATVLMLVLATVPLLAVSLANCNLGTSIGCFASYGAGADLGTIACHSTVVGHCCRPRSHQWQCYCEWYCHRAISCFADNA